MTQLKFDEDGRIILPDSVLKEKEEERTSIVIRRVQMSVKPAWAQVIIELPDNKISPARIERYYELFGKQVSSSVVHRMHQRNDRTFVIEVPKGNGTWDMYTALDKFIYLFREEFAYENKVIIIGSWEKYNY